MRANAFLCRLVIIEARGPLESETMCGSTDGRWPFNGSTVGGVEGGPETPSRGIMIGERARVTVRRGRAASE
eukprot:863673-Rhodomonas_salina.1